MKDILPDVERWVGKRKSIAMATVIQTWGSSPRQVGAKMAVTSDTQVSGSVSAGCVEAAVIETALDVIKTGVPQLLHYGVTNDAAWDVGMTCGGTIEIFVKRFELNSLEAVRTALKSERSLVIVTVIQGPPDMLGQEVVVFEDTSVMSTLGGNLDALVIDSAREAMMRRQSCRLPLPSDPPDEIFLDVIAPAPEIIMVGGVHIAITLTQLATALGYRTTVIDPRGVFGNEE